MPAATPSPAIPDRDDTLAGERFAPLYLGSFIAYGDRFSIGPLLVLIAADFGVSLGTAAAVATLYLFLYGVLQPVYGVLSDRFGRVRVMRAALVGVVASNVFCSLAPSVGSLVVGRGVAAGFAAALLPTSLVYVGDKVPFSQRQRVIANVLGAGALGTVGATVVSGVIGGHVSWRIVFLVTAALALIDTVVLRHLPESLPARASAGPLVQIPRVLRQPWALFLFALAAAEGAAMLGFVTFLAPALQTHGVSSAQAGLVVAVYGVAVFAGLQLVKRLLRRLHASPVTLISTGGSLLLTAYLVAATAQGVPNILAASLLIGVAFSFMHSTLQTWATEVVPEARGTATSLFVTSVFTGASIAHVQVSGLAGAHRFQSLFLVAAAVTLPVVVVASLARARFQAPVEPAMARPAG